MPPIPGFRPALGLLALFLLGHPATLRASCRAEDCPLTLRGTHVASQPFSFGLSYQDTDQDRIQLVAPTI